MLLQQLEKINTQVKQCVPWVNSGGCAYYAALIHRRLSELNVPVELAAYNYIPPEGAAHVFVTFKYEGEEYFHDGVYTTPTWMAPVSMWDALPDVDPVSLVDENRWNDMFEVEPMVPVLRQIITEQLGSFSNVPHFHNQFTEVEV